MVITRRDLLLAPLAAAALRCATEAGRHADASIGRLGAIPSRPATSDTPTPEPQRLGIATGDRDGVIYVPNNVSRDGAPLFLMLHGASGSGARFIHRFIADADRTGAIVIAPDSRGVTWDVSSRRGLGVDVELIDKALGQTFARYAIDPHRIVVGGFSDGATYSLTLGLTNGDLFSRIIAFSPGYLFLATRPAGKPPIFISHGTKDTILPIERCGRPIAAQLRRGGYSVDFREFDGPHTVPSEIASAAFDWAL